MTLGSDLVAKARSTASKKNRKIGVPKPYRDPVDESSSHASVVEEETREGSSSPTIEKSISDDDNLKSLKIPFSTTTHARRPTVPLSSSAILRRKLRCLLRSYTFP